MQEFQKVDVARPAEEHVAAESAHALPLPELLTRLEIDPQHGLTTADAEKRLRQSGPNALAEIPPVPLWRKVLAQFQDVVIWILLIAAVISGLTGDWTDAAAIIAIVVLNAALGLFQEERAQQALVGLRQMIVPIAKTLRDGHWLELPAKDLTPGDIIQLEAGDRVPADVRLVHSSTLKIQEAVLTGESMPVEKDAAAELSAEMSLADRRNMAYLSTTVSAGTAQAVVIATGMQTQIGQIAGFLETYDHKQTPLQKQLESVGRLLAVICLGIVAVVFGLNLWRGEPLLDALLVAVSLAVAAVPEGLPAVVTTALALGLQRMVRRNALIRKLPSVETLGCVTVICSDKTGTLTRNEMTVREIIADRRRFLVTGTGYAPRGVFQEATDESAQPTPQPSLPASMTIALQIGAVCNNSRLEPGEEADTWHVIGDPMEGALIVAAMKADVKLDREFGNVLREEPFDSERKMMSVLVRTNAGELQQFTKGAPENVLERCQSELVGGELAELTPDRRQELLQRAEEMAARALRVLCTAYRTPANDRDLEETDLTFAGLMGIIDPPRDEAREAIAKCRSAGIRTVMITGDHPTTAVAVARELGLIADSDEAMTGLDLDRVDEAELRERVEQTAVYARVAPAHKLRVVQALQARGHVVAMTGDGVNDAPAVKAADIGIAMGRTGTDVTRESAAMVLMDDNFTSIVSAVEEGRAIYDNIQKFLAYLLSCNVGEMLLMLVAGIAGWPAPLLPIQLLWINLVTDGLPALALAMEPAEPDLMQRPPRDTSEAMLNWKLGTSVIIQGLLLAIIGLIAFRYGMAQTNNVDFARTLAFNAVVFGELLRALAARSTHFTFWQLGAVSNPYIFAAVLVSALAQICIMTLPFARPVFEVSVHAWQDWLLVGGLALVPVSVLEIYKLVQQWRGIWVNSRGVMVDQANSAK